MKKQDKREKGIVGSAHGALAAKKLKDYQKVVWARKAVRP